VWVARWPSAPTLTLERNVSMFIYYIYQHRRNDTGEVFYVGKGKNRRCFQKTNRNKHWHHITEKTEYQVEILFENLSEDVAYLVEIGLITKYKSQGLQLCNYTIGGAGYSSNKDIKRVSARRKSGYKLSEEHKHKISLGNKGKQISSEQREKISNTLKGKKLSEDHKQKIRDGMSKKKVNS